MNDFTSDNTLQSEVDAPITLSADLARDIRQAVADPGSFLPRGNNYEEPVPRWSSRAVVRVIEAWLNSERLLGRVTHPLLVRAVGERRRQVAEKGFTADRDDMYCQGELHRAALAYLTGNAEIYPFQPVELEHWAQLSYEDRLAKVIALLMAEWDRQQRIQVRED